MMVQKEYLGREKSNEEKNYFRASGDGYIGDLCCDNYSNY